MISILDSLRSICTEEEYMQCHAWATAEGYSLHSKWLAEESLAKAKAVKENWSEAKETLSSTVPTLKTSNLTVRQLHAYLSMILKERPALADSSIMCEDGYRKSTEVVFDENTTDFYIS